MVIMNVTDDGVATFLSILAFSMTDYTAYFLPLRDTLGTGMVDGR